MTIKFILNKLTADKTLDSMQSEGIITKHRVIVGEELIQALNKKLIEETAEVVDAQDRNELISELADVLQIVEALSKAHGISPDEIKMHKDVKFLKRGGYEKGLFLETIEMDDNSSKAAHFRKSPNKYIEIK